MSLSQTRATIVYLAEYAPASTVARGSAPLVDAGRVGLPNLPAGGRLASGSSAGESCDGHQLDRPVEPVVSSVSDQTGAAGGAKSFRRSIATSGTMFWGGTVALGVSTVVLLAVLSRHLHHDGFAGLSALLGLLFVASLIPSGVPLRAAALAADGRPPPRMTIRITVLFAVPGLAISPLIGYMLHVPVVAIDLIVAQVIVAIPLGIRRGAFIADHRFTVLGVNIFLEAASRILLGTAGGLIYGITGLAAGLALATTLALLVLPLAPPYVVAPQRPMTSLLDTWLTLVLLGLFVQLDILVAPSGLSKLAVTRYDVAAVPSKGVYLLLAAASTFVFPYVRVRAQRRLVVVAALATLALGLSTTALLILLRSTIGDVLGQDAAAPLLLLALGSAMSVAGATGVIVNCDVALGVARPWPPLLLGILAVLGVWLARPSASVFAATVLVAQACTFLVSLWVCLKGKRRSAAPAPEVPGERCEIAGAPTMIARRWSALRSKSSARLWRVNVVDDRSTVPGLT